METAEEVTVAGPPRVTPRLVGCRRQDCGLPGAAARVDSAPRPPPPLLSARGSSRVTLSGPKRNGAPGPRCAGPRRCPRHGHGTPRRGTRAPLPDEDTCGQNVPGPPAPAIPGRSPRTGAQPRAPAAGDAGGAGQVPPEELPGHVIRGESNSSASQLARQQNGLVRLDTKYIKRLTALVTRFREKGSRG